MSDELNMSSANIVHGSYSVDYFAKKVVDSFYMVSRSSVENWALAFKELMIICHEMVEAILLYKSVTWAYRTELNTYPKVLSRAQ